jgi:hypothetical protein
MAEGDGSLYYNFAEQLMRGGIDLSSDTIKVMLVVGHTPDLANHEKYSDVSGDEGVGAGYTAGGEEVTGKTVTQDNPNTRAVFDGIDTGWAGVNVGLPSHAILHDETPSDDWLIGYWELSTYTNGGPYTLQWHATDGILTLTVQ